MKAWPIYFPPPLRILRLSLFAGVVLAATGHAVAGEKIIFSGRFEKRGLPISSIANDCCPTQSVHSRKPMPPARSSPCRSPAPAAP